MTCGADCEPGLVTDLVFDPTGRPRKPLILGIGAQKAGTSWLSQMLGQHPRIWATPLKEVQFFNHLYIPGHRYWIDWHYRNKPQEIRARFKKRGEPLPVEMDDYLTRLSTAPNRYTRGWYQALFQPAPDYAFPMETTPEYSQLPDNGVEFVTRWLPETRFLYLIRDPADRAISQLKMNLDREKRRPASLDEWLREAANPVLNERGDYATYVPRWQRHAGGRVLFLPYGRIGREPLALLEEVEAFCGIGPWEYSNPQARVFAGPKGITVPPEAVAAVRERLQPQYDFLRETFGADFLALTK